MTDNFKTPQPGALLEMPEGWDVLYAADKSHAALTDERIIDIAVCHSNHKLKAQSGTEFEVISHRRLIAFAREIERAVYRHQGIWPEKIYELFGHEMAVHNLDQKAGAA